jgi:hypothetical protein
MIVLLTAVGAALFGGGGLLGYALKRRQGDQEAADRAVANANTLQETRQSQFLTLLDWVYSDNLDRQSDAIEGIIAMRQAGELTDVQWAMAGKISSRILAASKARNEPPVELTQVQSEETSEEESS